MQFLRTMKPDLVVLDVVMPAIDGMEALDRMTGRYRDVPIILHTSYPQYKENFISYAADAYVNKSLDLTDLKRVIGDLLKRSLRKN